MKTALLLLALIAFAAAQTNPSFNQIANIKVNENAGLQTVMISGISAGEADVASLQFFASSSNRDLVAGEDISINFRPGSTATTTTMSYTPVPGQSGTSKITVSLYGQKNGAILGSSKEFTIEVIKTDVDCDYGSWGSWSKCDQQCGGGRRTRNRAINQQAQGNGQRCDPNAQVETQNCNQQACLAPTINIVADQSVSQDTGSHYVDLSGISAGQGESNQIISIKANSGNTNLITIPKENVIYHSPASVGKLWYNLNSGQYGSSNVVVTVSDSGSQGSSAGSYTSSTSFTVNVVPTPIDCLYEWAQWSSCSATCGDGTRTRDSIVTRRPNSNGLQCPSPLPRETGICYSGPCPVDCIKYWGEYLPCSVSCGTGTQTRYELIKSYPQNGGKSCGTLDKQTRECRERACPVDCVTQWEEWSTCSVSCGSGTASRTKRIVIAASNGGDSCPSPLPREDRACNLEPCPNSNDCHVNDWSQWSMCSTSCTKMRHRSVTREAMGGRQCPSLREDSSCTGESCSTGINGGRGSCERKCGQTSTSGCNCDANCLRYGDCCSDFTRFCNSNGQAIQQGGCQGMCGGPGRGGNCQCDQACEIHGDCCNDYRMACQFGGGGFGYGFGGPQYGGVQAPFGNYGGFNQGYNNGFGGGFMPPPLG